MDVVALAGGVGAGKFLRGLVRVIPPEDVTVVVNTGDDLVLHGLRISPDLDSVTYWLAGIADRERGWGRASETFRAVEEVRRLGGQAWFALGDLDLGVHLTRTQLMRDGLTLSAATDRIRAGFGIESRILPMSDDRVETWITTIHEDGERSDVPFQTYWVAERAAGRVERIRFEGIADAKPAPGVRDAIAAADVVLICPSNPVVSIGPILQVPGISDAIRERSGPAVGISPIVGGAPVLGMADRLMPAAGLEVSALGAARPYRGLLRGWVIDDRDADMAGRIREELAVQVGVTDTIMRDDTAAERLAAFAMDLARS